MLLQRKIDRAMDWLKEKNNPGQDRMESSDKFSEDNSDLYAYDPKAEWKAQEENLELEKGDALGILISSMIVFGPIFLVLIVILILVFPGFNAIK